MTRSLRMSWSNGIGGTASLPVLRTSTDTRLHFRSLFCLRTLTIQKCYNQSMPTAKTKEKSKLLEGLNQEQVQAVTHGGGPLLIIAGAGTGKTTVITRRIVWLIEQGLANPAEIL